MSEGKRKTWMEIRVERELAKGAVWPPSKEQIEEEVGRRRKAIADKIDVEQAAWDIQYEMFVKALKAKNN